MACVEGTNTEAWLSAEIRDFVCESMLQQDVLDKLAAYLRGQDDPREGVRQVVGVVVDRVKQVGPQGCGRCGGDSGSHWKLLALLYDACLDTKVDCGIVDAVLRMAEENCRTPVSSRGLCCHGDRSKTVASGTESGAASLVSVVERDLMLKQDSALEQEKELIAKRDTEVTRNTALSVKQDTGVSPMEPSTQFAGRLSEPKRVKEDSEAARNEDTGKDGHIIQNAISCFLEFVRTFDVFEGRYRYEIFTKFLGQVIVSEAASASVKKAFMVEVVTMTELCILQMQKGILEHRMSCALFVPFESNLDNVPVASLTDLIEVLKTDNHRVCQTYAFLVAAFSGNWEVASELLQSGARCLTYTLCANYMGCDDLYCQCSKHMDLFKTALARFPTHAGCLLEFCCGRLPFPDVECAKEQEGLYDIGLAADLCTGAVTLLEYLKEKAANDETLFPQLLEQCRQNELFAAGTLAAVWAGRSEEAKQLTLSGDIDYFLTTFLANYNLRLLMNIISCVPQGCQLQALVHLVVKWTWALPRSRGRYVVKKLLKLSTDPGVLVEEVLYQAMEFSDKDLFEALVTADPVDLSRVKVGDTHGPVFSTIVRYLSMYSMHTSRWSGRDRRIGENFYHMLVKCIESGLSTQHVWKQPSAACRRYWSHLGSSFPFETAVRAKKFGLARLLLECGASCQAELHRLSLDTSLRSSLEEEHQPLLQFFDDKSSSPHSLQKSCLFTVSRLIGCRADRKHRALSLGLPMELVRRVLFFDLLFAQDMQRDILLT